MLARLIAHMEWANARVMDAFRATTHPNQLLIDLFAHLLAAEHVWLARVTGTTPSHPVWPHYSLAECAKLAQENSDRFAALAAELTAASEARPVTYTNSAGQTFTSTVAEILTHVAMHGSYHRGQIAWQMRADGGRATSTDFIAFIRGAPAAARQDPK